MNNTKQSIMFDSAPNVQFTEMLSALIRAEEKKLGVAGEEFMQRHNEIMADIQRARRDFNGCRFKRKEIAKGDTTT